MSLNLGNDAVAAARQLVDSPQFNAVIEGVHEAFRRVSNQALESGAPNDIGYARALRDVFMALESARTGAPLQRTEKPAPVGRAK